MHRVISSFLLLICLFAACPVFAQDDPNSATATCNFDDEKQLVVQYQHVPISLKKPLGMQVPMGKPWAPGGKPMTLFTNAPIQIGSRALAIGAYTMFVIPGNKQWTLIVSKSTDMSGAYDQQQDLIRVPMDSGELPSSQADLAVSFGHTAPDQCTLRVDLEKFGHFAVFQKK
jgi:hypothetical protein